MSRSAIQVAKAATYLPDLVEVQRSSFKWFLDKGLIEELDNFSPITDYTGKLELHFIGAEYKPLKTTEEGLGWIKEYENIQIS